MMDEALKQLIWEGSSKRDFLKFPIPAQRHLGAKLLAVQLGEFPARTKPLSGMGSGIFELRSEIDGDAYRVVYVTKIGSSIYVLHAFKKKSKQGISTPRPDIEMIKARLKQLSQRINN